MIWIRNVARRVTEEARLIRRDEVEQHALLIVFRLDALEVRAEGRASKLAKAPHEAANQKALLVFAELNSGLRGDQALKERELVVADPLNLEWDGDHADSPAAASRVAMSSDAERTFGMSRSGTNVSATATRP